MDRDLTLLSEKALKCLKKSSNNRILITIAGSPGSGKSTIAQAITESIYYLSCNTNSKFKPKSIALGMDGYHFSRGELKRMPDPELAFLRRGASFTFDVEGVVKLAKVLRNSCEVPEDKREIITVPSFDHKLKDPLPNGIVISPDINIILLEGNYLLLNIEPWNEIGAYADERWFVDINLAIARERLAKRHVEAGIEKDMNSALIRVDNNDLINGIYILEHRALHIDYIISG